MKVGIRIGILAIILGVFGYTLYFLYMENEAPEITYEIVYPFKDEVIKKTVATGSIVPRKEILIKAVVSGIIDKIFVEAGDKIKKGDVIAQIRIIPNLVNLSSAQNRLERAKLSLENAQMDYDRNNLLFKDNVVSKANFQPIELALRNAKLEVLSAEDNLQIIEEGVSKDGSSATNTLIRSTISGMVLDVPVEEGNQVIESSTFNEGTTVASVADMTDMIFLGNLDESEVGKVHSGMQLILTIGALHDLSLGAVLEYIAPKGVDLDGAIQFEIRAKINPKELQANFIRSGYSANASIVFDKKTSQLVIKESIVEYVGDSAFVYIEVDTQVFNRTQIKVGLSDGVIVIVEEGINKDTRLRGNENDPESKVKSKN